MDWTKVPYQELAIYVVSNVVSNGFDVTVADDRRILTWCQRQQAVCLECDFPGKKWKYFWMDGTLTSAWTSVPINKLVFTIQGIIDNLRYVR